MRIAVLGAGMTGLTTAYRLGIAGHRCDVYERWPGLGGQVATLDAGGVLLERYYHHLFTSDREITALYDELGMGGELEWLPSSVAMFAGGKSHPFTTPLDLLRFSPMSLRGRIRMGLAVFLLQRRHRQVEPFESMTAHEWVHRSMGHEAWDRVWGPLLVGKFGERAEEISMAWLWSKLTLRRRLEGREARGELLGYPRGSWQPLLDRLAAEIEGRGGRILIDRPAARIERGEGGIRIVAGASDSFRRGHDPAAFETLPDPSTYDAVVATVPTDVFSKLLAPELEATLSSDYRARLKATEYQAAVCLLLELDRQFSPFYWTNVAEPGMPFIGVIEQTNLVEPARYGGRRFTYIANYVAGDDPLLDLDMESLIKLYEPGFRKINPAWERSWVKDAWLFREPAAQPIVTTGYPARIPPLRTRIEGLYLANTTQIYPEDRGTNYSVRLGDEVASTVLHDAR